MAFGLSLLQSHLANLGNLLDGSQLNSDASKAVEQKVAGEFSALVNQGDNKNGIVSLTQQLNHATSDIAFGDGVCKLTGDVSGQEQNLVTDISSTSSNVATMTGETTETVFRKKYYGGTSTEAISAMLQEGTGQSVDQLAGTVSNTHTSKYQGTVRPALTTTLQSILSVAQGNFGNLLKTFVPSSIGNVLEDIADGLDKSGSLSDRIQSLAQGRLTDGQLQDAITFIGNNDKNSAINIISSVSDLPVTQIETEVNTMSTALSDRVTGATEDTTDMPDFIIGSTRDGFDDEFNANSQFSMINSYEALEADFRNATRDITEIVLHWSESGTNQFLTAEDLNEIQGGIRYHYCILRDGTIQKGLSINKIGNHIPTAVVANRVAKLQSNPSTAAVRATRSPVGGETTPKGQHNTVSIGVCIIGGIAAPAGGVDYERYLSSKSFTTSQWNTIDEMLKTFFKVFPGGQAFGHNDIENNETDPGFSVPNYVLTKFQKTSSDGVAKTTTEINSNPQ